MNISDIKQLFDKKKLELGKFADKTDFGTARSAGIQALKEELKEIRDMAIKHFHVNHPSAPDSEIDKMVNDHGFII